MANDYQSKMAEMASIQQQIQSISQIVNAKEQAILQAQTQLKQGQEPNNSAQQLQYNLRNAVGPFLQPGNINDINNVIWPFYFTTDIPDNPLDPGDSFPTGFSVTYEAAFIFMSMTKVVYLNEGGSWTYLNPDVPGPSAPGLVYSMRDGSSTRQFNNSTPPNLDAFGNPRFPTKYPRPMMMLPNQVMQITFTNTHASNSYVPLITAFGYRIRLDRAQDLLSLVYG